MSARQNIPAARLNRWRAVLVNLVFNLLMFESLSGFLLFFSRGFLTDPDLISAAHWWLGVAFAVPYSLYQWRHYTRVRGFTDRLQYQVGLVSFFTMVVVILSGVVLYFVAREAPAYVVVDLVHIMMGFAFLILISTHLVLVYRVGARESGARNAQSLRGMVLRRTLWVPTIVGIVLLVGLTLVF